jgi:hypothetical protein
MARTRKKQQLQRFRVALVGDGQTERIYFSDVRDTDRPANLAIFPDFPKKFGSYIGVLERAIELSEDYDRTYALIDMDTVIRQNQQTAYSQAKAKAEAKGVFVLENNPCFEIWLLLHFLHTGRLFNSCDEISIELKKKDRIPGYNKSERFLLNALLYKTHKGKIENPAVPNAKLLEKKRATQDQLFPRAETFRFFEWYFAQRLKGSADKSITE